MKWTFLGWGVRGPQAMHPSQCAVWPKAFRDRDKVTTDGDPWQAWLSFKASLRMNSPMSTFQTQKLVVIALACAGAVELFFMPLGNGGGQALLVSAWSATEVKNGMMGIDRIFLAMEVMRGSMIAAFLYLLIPDWAFKAEIYRRLYRSAKTANTRQHSLRAFSAG
jgi:hypothetical protein